MVAGGWSVTVAGSCPGALPADVEMRLRFPQPHQTHPTQPPYQRCSCRTRVSCACSAATERVCSPTPVSAATLPPPARRRLSHNDTKLTLTMKKEARDSSILTSKSMRKSIDPLPDLETYRSSRSKVKSSVKAVVSDATGLLPALLAARRTACAHKVLTNTFTSGAGLLSLSFCNK